MSASVAVLDEDHVLRMVADVLAARTAADWSRVGEFFAPDVADPAALEELREGITLAGPGEPATAGVLPLPWGHQTPDERKGTRAAGTPGDRGGIRGPGRAATVPRAVRRGAFF